MNPRNRLLLLLLLIVSLILIILLVIYLNNKDGFETKKETIYDDKFQLVISRFNEDLEWLKNHPFTDFTSIVIYNKGNDDNYYKPPNSKKIKLKNVGKCDHTYLYHIIENYDNLPEGFLFLPGSADMNAKLSKSIQTSNLVLNHNKKSVMVCSLFENVQKQLYNFVKEDYKTAYGPNYNKNKITKTTKANIRPFGKWFNDKFGEILIRHVTFGGIFAISKVHIQNRPKMFYEKLLAELNYINPEVGHFIERSWEAIFYPMNDAIFVESKYKLDIIGTGDQNVI